MDSLLPSGDLMRTDEIGNTIIKRAPCLLRTRNVTKHLEVTVAA
jgi:hypothetical protein